MNLKQQSNDLLDRIWSGHPNPWAERGLHALRLLICTFRELSTGELTLRAMSLVYTTLLSLVPLLALAFSILKGLGVHNRIEPMLAAMLQPLGASADKLTEMVIGFVDHVKIGVLGSIGVALLFYTVLSMIQKVEASFNFIWKIPRERPLTQRVSEYLVVLLLGPLAMTLVLGLTASLSSNRVVEGLMDYEVIGASVYLAGRLLPYLMIVGIFSFIFMFIPNTRVKLRPAIVAGLISGLLWQSAAWGFANFVANSGNYNAVYSSFAIIILLLIWFYLAWLILLTGCQIAFFMQHPEYLTRQRHVRPAGSVLRERLALTLMAIVLRRFKRGQPAPSAVTLARASKAPPDLVNPLIDDLLNAGFLVETVDGDLMPGRDPAHLRVQDFLDALGQTDCSMGRVTGIDERVDELSLKLARAREQALGDLRFDDLLEPTPSGSK